MGKNIPGVAPETTTVSLVQSPVKDASRFDYPEIRRIVREAVNWAGGLGGIVNDGDVVVLKPNIVATRGNPGLSFLNFEPYQSELQIPKEVNGITTDYRVARAVVEIVREFNPSGKVFVMEGSAWGSTSTNFKLMGYTHGKIPGVDRFIALDDMSSYASLNSEDLVAVDLKEKAKYPGSRMPHIARGSYYFNRTYFHADVLISIPVLKNHLYTGMSGGIKNVGIGATPPAVYGKDEGRAIRIKKIHHGWGPLNGWIHDYYLCRPVDFVVTDGLQGSQYGPRAQGTGSVKKALMNMRLILAGKDPVAVDTVHSYIVGTDAEKVDHLRDLAASGSGINDSRYIAVTGNRRVHEVKKDFKLSPIFGIVYRGRRSKYGDFKAPRLELKSAAVGNNTLVVDTKAALKITKIEVFVDGRLHKVFHDGFDHMEIPFKEDTAGGNHKVTFYAYDRYLNCAIRTVKPGGGPKKSKRPTPKDKVL